MRTKRISLKYVIGLGVLGALSFGSLGFATKPVAQEACHACYDVCYADCKANRPAMGGKAAYDACILCCEQNFQGCIKGAPPAACSGVCTHL